MKLIELFYNSFVADFVPRGLHFCLLSLSTLVTTTHIQMYLIYLENYTQIQFVILTIQL